MAYLQKVVDVLGIVLGQPVPVKHAKVRLLSVNSGLQNFEARCWFAPNNNADELGSYRLFACAQTHTHTHSLVCTCVRAAPSLECVRGRLGWKPKQPRRRHAAPGDGLLPVPPRAPGELQAYDQISLWVKRPQLQFITTHCASKMCITYYVCIIAYE